MKISASFLSSSDLKKTVYELSVTDVDYIHVDFIDGKFVSGTKIAYRKIKKVTKFSSKRLDVHLMTDKLDKYIKKFALLNCEYITFHVEATKDISKYISLIHSYGIKCGLAVNPDTSIQEIEPYVNDIDMVLVMSVAPGKGGQTFIPDAVNKLKDLEKLLRTKKSKVLVSIDGGINDTTVSSVGSLVDMLVSGSFITSSDNYQEKINILRKNSKISKTTLDSKKENEIKKESKSEKTNHKNKKKTITQK